MEYTIPSPEAIPYTEVDFSTIQLGDRFIHRIDKFGCYYVQLRVFIKGKAYYGAAKTFYDNHYGNREIAYKAAVEFRESHVYDFFKENNYDPTLNGRRSLHARLLRERPRKFTIRKEAKSGLMSNLRFIRIRKGRYCVLEVTVNVHGKQYQSKAYGYSYKKYGDKAAAINAAKKDRDLLVPLIFERSTMFNKLAPQDPDEIYKKIKGVRIKQTAPKFSYDINKFLRRAKDGDYWIVELRKQINYLDFRPANLRFYDIDYGNKNKSQIIARKYVIYSMSNIFEAARIIRKDKIYDKDKITEMLEMAINKASMLTAS
jgi:hypothetical protein